MRTYTFVVSVLTALIIHLLRHTIIDHLSSFLSRLSGENITKMPVLADCTLKSSEQIASLWSGYGHITRRTYTNNSASPPAILTTILKQVSAPPKNRYDESHVRKMISYNIERYFYTHLSQPLNGTSTHIAKLYECTSDSIEMEDLSILYPMQPHTLNYKQTKVALRSLASFHATFWGAEHPLIPPPSPNSMGNLKSAAGIWEEGSYWYLRTRTSEYSSLTPKWKSIARKIDGLIRAIPPQFQTVIHGDLKYANIMFSQDNSKCAFYDLQYVGRSPGMRDLSKFFISSVGGLERYEEEFLRFYYDELMRGLKSRGLGEDYSFEILMTHYELCLVDYYRFMLSWVCESSSPLS